ncbi:hypothetical protein GCM10010112_26890 [Actinoplanes lobatus]|uniref:Lipoprotein n=1 Tax=Actinoplanes lobatus TaxID=113568 RepID=A0ABQ4AQR8_9ACTN|nr:hypothetical protein GCM10010112_26890 [Actinoplanes lobatus]GIE43313.1 hypothetical protein Alo02nite_62110 [Actinoplanes lobatus]
MRGVRVGIPLLVLLGSVALAACGSADADAGAAQAGTTPSLGPGKYAGDDLTRPTLPAARGPVLHVENTYTYTVQVLDAMTTLSMPSDPPPPAGTTALVLLLRVEADPPERRITAPIQHLSIDYPSRRQDLNQYIGTVFDGREPYLTEDQVLFGGDGAEGVDVLEANTVYYTWAWQLVSEKADLEGASLCDVSIAGKENCIPVGTIRAD